VTFFVLFFLFRDGMRMTHVLAFLLPIQERHSSRLFEEVRRSIVANLKGMLVVAIVQGLLAAAGYYALRVPSAGMLAFLTAGVIAGSVSSPASSSRNARLTVEEY